MKITFEREEFEQLPPVALATELVNDIRDRLDKGGADKGEIVRDIGALITKYKKKRKIAAAADIALWAVIRKSSEGI